MTEWHCTVGGQKYGPVGEDELRAWATEGRLKPTDMVWTEGMAEWAPAASVGGLFAATAAPVGPAQTITSFARPHRGGGILALGIISIVLALSMWCSIAGLICGVIALTMSKKDMPLLQAGQMDPRGLGVTQAGRICGIIGTALSGVMLAIFLIYVIVMAGFIGRHMR